MAVHRRAAGAEPLVSHATFHLLYLPIIAAAGWFGLRLARTGTTRPLRISAALVVATQAVAFVGHVGELWVVMDNGGFDAPESVFDLPPHAAFADVTPLALLVSALVVVVATFAWAAERRRARRADLAAT